MTAIEIPNHVCHILDTHYCGEEAVIGDDCPGEPLWDFACVDADLAPASHQTLTLLPAPPLTLPLTPIHEEP